MKKLFFAAVFAVVAVGGAFATNSKKVLETGDFYSINAEEPDIHCTEGELLCSSFYSGTAWDGPESDENRVPVDLSEYEHN